MTTENEHIAHGPPLSARDLLSLASAISPRMQMDRLILLSCQASHDIVAGRQYQPEFTFDVAGDLSSVHGNQLPVQVNISLKMTPVEKDKGRPSDPGGPDHPSLTIGACFQLDYTWCPTTANSPTPSGDSLRAFARVSSIYHAWPFWREFVHSTMTRMGLPPAPVPLLTGMAIAEICSSEDNETPSSEIPESE